MQLMLRQTSPMRIAIGDVWSFLGPQLAGRLDGRPFDTPPDLMVFPELSLTEYDLGHRAPELALSSSTPPPIRPPHGTVVVGFPERGDDGLIYNSAGAFDADGWRHIHRKRYMPTYGMFDEARIFASGPRGPRIFHPHPDWPTSILICEELWHPSTAYLAALQGAALLVVTAAAPGRGRPDPDDVPERFASQKTWRLLAQTAAVTHGMYVALVNRVGVEGGVTFAGGSLVVAPDGKVLVQAGHDEEDVALELDLERVLRARHPFSHLRDEDPAFMARELDRILRARTDGDD